jgi:hypothetical protein
MGFGRRKKGITKKFFVFIIILCVIATLGYYGYIYYNNQMVKIENEYIDQINDLKIDKYMSKRVVYIASKEIKKGEIIDNNCVKKIDVFSNFDANIFIEESDLGARVLITIDEDLPVLKSMLYKSNLRDDERIKELSLVLLQSDLEKYEFVDFRIRYSNGLEYTVLSKKEIIKIDLENNTVWLSLNEEERLMLSSALVDKAIYIGTSFYIDRYVESNIQKESFVNYLPNNEIMNLMAINSNIERKFINDEIAKRIKIEEKLSNTSEQQLSMINDSILNEEIDREERITKEINIVEMNIEEDEEIEMEESKKNGFN